MANCQIEIMHFVKKILYVSPYKLQLLFEDDTVRQLDLKQKLLLWSEDEKSIFKQLLEKNYFKTVKLNPEMETIYWDNGVDFCPDMLYDWSTQDEIIKTQN